MSAWGKGHLGRLEVDSHILFLEILIERIAVGFRAI